MAGFVLPIISGLAGLFGGGKQSSQNTKSSGTQDQTSNSEFSSTSTPNLSPYQQALANMFTQGASDLYNKSTNLNPYAQQGQQQILNQGDAQRKMISNMLAQRGLSFSPASSVPLTMNAMNTGGQMNNFLSQIPLLQRQLQTQGLEGLMNAFRTLPTSVTNIGTQNGTSHTDSSQTGQANLFGNPAAGGLSGFGAGLGASGILGNLPMLFGNKSNAFGNGYGANSGG